MRPLNISIDMLIAMLTFWLVIPWILELFELSGLNLTVILIYGAFLCLLYLQIYLTSFKSYPNTPKATQQVENENNRRRTEGRFELTEIEVKKMHRNSLLLMNALQLAVTSIILIGASVIVSFI